MTGMTSIPIMVLSSFVCATARSMMRVGLAVSRMPPVTMMVLLLSAMLSFLSPATCLLSSSVVRLPRFFGAALSRAIILAVVCTIVAPLLEEAIAVIRSMERTVSPSKPHLPTLLLPTNTASQTTWNPARHCLSTHEVNQDLGAVDESTMRSVEC